MNLSKYLQYEVSRMARKIDDHIITIDDALERLLDKESTIPLAIPEDKIEDCTAELYVQKKEYKCLRKIIQNYDMELHLEKKSIREKKEAIGELITRVEEAEDRHCKRLANIITEEETLKPHN